MIRVLATVSAFMGLFSLVYGHGYALEPIARGSRWRFNSSAPVNTDDTGLWCGGFGVQYWQNGGKCGICGDNYGDQVPRLNEFGGKFGEGVIVQTYPSGQVVSVQIRITVNHRGYFYFDMCNLDEIFSQGGRYEQEECFKRIKTVSGEDTWPLTSTEAKVYQVDLSFPNIECKHCVFRWTYVAGNNWGVCSDGTSGMGCGPQEHFRTCSDISVVNNNVLPDGKLIQLIKNTQ